MPQAPSRLEIKRELLRRMQAEPPFLTVQTMTAALGRLGIRIYRPMEAFRRAGYPVRPIGKRLHAYRDDVADWLAADWQQG